MVGYGFCVNFCVYVLEFVCVGCIVVGYFCVGFVGFVVGVVVGVLCV